MLRLTVEKVLDLASWWYIPFALKRAPTHTNPPDVGARLSANKAVCRQVQVKPLAVKAWPNNMGTRGVV